VTLSPQWLDELRARTVLSAVISPSVKLIRAGREWKACCPFHNEKTPSFTINDDKGFYHCLAADTVVMTRRGAMRIADLSGHRAEVLGSSGRWIAAPFDDYGRHRLWEIALTRSGVAKKIFATSRHRWFVNGRRSEVLTRDLAAGSRLESTRPDPCSDWTLDPAGVRHGIIFGDGTMYRGVYGVLNLHGSHNMALAAWFPDHRPVLKHRGPELPYFHIYGGRAFADMKDLPRAGTSDAYLLGFLAGYIAADGHVAKDGTVMLNSARREHLLAVRDIAGALGIVTYGLTTQRRIGIDGHPSELHRIHFATSSLSPELFLKEEARRRFAEHCKAFDRMRWTVQSVIPTDRVEPVYCAQVPEDHAFALDDNILTGNCFGCGAHGDAIRFLTDHRGMPFMDAVKELAAKAGMDVPAPDPKAKERADRASSLTDVMAAVAKWYTEQLNGPSGSGARDYLKRRGIEAATIQRFGLGYAADSRTSLKRALEGLGEDKLVESGMLIKPEEGSDSYDRFRGRLMFPIRDPRGRVIGFGGRILGEGEPKYLNSPDTPLFDKGRTLYNIDQASPASRAAKRLIVVEGYMDVIALDRAGISEVVAPNGTAVTEAQLERLWRLDPSPIMCFDGDSAGRKAAIRAATRALPLIRPDRTLRFVELPQGQDPDDIIRTGGREAFEALIAEPEPLDARLWRHQLEAQPLRTPEAWASLKQQLIDHAASIGHPELSRMYREDWLNRFYEQRRPASKRPSRATEFQRKGTSRNGWFAPPLPPVGSHARAIAAAGIDAPTARALILGFTNFPEELPAHCEQLAAIEIADRTTAKMRDELVNAAFSGAALDRESLSTILGGDGATGPRGLSAMGFSFTRRDSDPDRARSDLAAAVEIIAAAEEVTKALEDATERLKRDMTDEALEEQQRLITARHGLRQRLAQLAGTD
jgi:DNA primase